MIPLSEEIQKDKVFADWLKSLNSKNYQKKAKSQMKRFLKFLKNTYPDRKIASVTDILELRKIQDKDDNPKEKFWFDDLIPKYVEWQISTRKLSVNSALINTNPLRGFFAYYRYPLHVRKENLPKKEEVQADHRFTLEQIRRMAKFADPREKAILLAGKDLGLRVGDFCSLKRELITSQLERAKLEGREVEYPIEFRLTTEKTKAVAMCHLTRETVQSLQLYWESDPDSEYWFSNNGKEHITDNQCNYVLRKLWSVAYNDPKVFEPPSGIGEKTTGKIRWHGLRDFLISALANSGANNWTIKLMTGKKISADMKNYLDGLDLKEIYSKAEAWITVGGLTNHNHSKLSDLETKIESQNRVIVDQQIEIRDLNTNIQAMTSEVERLRSKLEKLYKVVEEYMQTKSVGYKVDSIFAKDEKKQ